MAKYVVDWDGTCVHEEWPGMGDWIPGAVDALKWMVANGGVIIYTLRTSDYEPGMTRPIKRAPGARQFEADRIRKKLDDASLQDVVLWPNNMGKPPGKYYVDDRAVVFDTHRGGWRDVMRRVR